jgi:hypothetical protein
MKHWILSSIMERLGSVWRMLLLITNLRAHQSIGQRWQRRERTEHRGRRVPKDLQGLMDSTVLMVLMVLKALRDLKDPLVPCQPLSGILNIQLYVLRRLKVCGESTQLT